VICDLRRSLCEIESKRGEVCSCGRNCGPTPRVGKIYRGFGSHHRWFPEQC